MVLKTVAGKIICPIRVGDILVTETASNPSNIYTGTTWKQVCVGRVPVGVSASEMEFNTVNKQGGNKTHTLAVAEMPVHSHGMNQGAIGTCNYGFGKEINGLATGSAWSDVKVGRGSPQSLKVGSGQAHNNIQPYETKYFWKRLS